MTVPFEEVKDFVRQQMVQEREKSFLEQYMEDLHKRSRITIDETALNEVKGTIY